MECRIQLKLSATLKRFAPPVADDYPIPPGSTVRELIDALGIPSAEVNLIFIDGRRANFEARLTGGEQVSVFPPLGGG